jgi:hypothetical protein
MSFRSVLRTVVRFCVDASVVVSGMTLGADDADARRGGKVRTTQPHTKSQSDQDSGAKQHDGAESTRKSGHADDGSDASPGGVYVPRVRSREASRGTSETKSDATGLESRRGGALIPVAGADNAAIKDIDVPGCTPGMICTVCLAGCSGSVNSIIDQQPMTPRPKPRQ